MRALFDKLFPGQELPGDRLHREVPPESWCITRSDLLEFREQVLQAVRDGRILPTERDNFVANDTVRGPNIYTVTEQLIKPVTREAGGMSWALMKNPGGLKCDLFVTHAWQEGIFEFVDKVLSSWPMDANHAYCCMLANPQNLDISSLIRSPRESPFARALDSAKYMLVVSNSKGSIYSRLWCVYEIYLAETWGKIIFTGRASLRRSLLKAFGLLLLSVLLGVLIGLPLRLTRESAAAARELSESSSFPGLSPPTQAAGPTGSTIIRATMTVTRGPNRHEPAAVIAVTAPPDRAQIIVDPMVGPITGVPSNFDNLLLNGSFYVTIAMLFALGAVLLVAFPYVCLICNHAIAVLCTIAGLQGMRVMGVFIAELYTGMFVCLCVFCIFSEFDRVRDVQRQLESSNLLHDYRGSVKHAQCFSKHDSECIWSDIGSQVEEVDQAVDVLIASSISTPLLRDAASEGVDVSGVGKVSLAEAVFGWSLWLAASLIHGKGWETFSASPASRWLVWLSLLVPSIAWALSILGLPFDYKPFAVRAVSMCSWAVPGPLVVLHILHLAQVDAMLQELLGIIYMAVLGWMILALSLAGPARVAMVMPCLANLYTAGIIGCFYRSAKNGKAKEQLFQDDTSSDLSGSSSAGETAALCCAAKP